MEAQRQYQRQLLQEFKRRQQLNPAYSLRAFSRTVGMSPAFVSKLLRSEKELSEKRARLVCQRLGYSPTEAERFCEMLRQEQVQTPHAELPPTEVTLTIDQFQIISDWYHIALAELTELKDFVPQTKWMARRLGIKEAQAADALNRLLRMGFLEQVGSSFRKKVPSVNTTREIPNRAIRFHHHQMMNKAQEALEAQTVSERHMESLSFAIETEQVPTAKAEIQRFIKRMRRILTTRKGDFVYQLNVQLFRLSGSEP